MVPFHLRAVVEIGHSASDCIRIVCLGVDEVEMVYYGCSRLHFLNVRTKLVGDGSKYAYNLPVFFELKLSGKVVGLHNFGWLDKKSLAGSGFIVDDTLYLTFVHRRNRYHKSSVTYGRSRVRFEPAL